MKERDNSHDAYLPGGLAPDFQLLVLTPYKREDLASIAGGADPEGFKRVDLALGTWGLLYIREGVPGFYVPPSESAMAALIRGPNGNRPEPIYLTLSADRMVGTRYEEGKRKDPPGIAGVLARAFGLGNKDRIDIAWNGSDGASRSVDFFPMREDASFLAALRALPWFME